MIFYKNPIQSDLVGNKRGFIDTKFGRAKIPFEGYSFRFEFLKKQILELFDEVILSGKYTGRGNRVIALEKSIKDLWGTTGIATSSGTISLQIALMCAGINPGDEVIVPSLTFISTAYAVNAVGGIPVFVDIDPKTLTINPDAVLDSITSKTVAIIPVHMYGQMADMDRLMDIAKKYNLKIIEDCAQAHGATYYGNYAGSMGDFGCFSFYNGKNIGGLEDGGMITMQDAKNVSQVLRLSDLGRIPGNRYNHEVFGLRGRMGEFTAALINLELKFLEEWNQRRNYIANYYNAHFDGLPLQIPFVAPGRTHVYYLYTVITDSVQTRQKLEDHLISVGIETMRIYPKLIPDQPVYQNGLPHRVGRLTIAKQIVEKLLSLPLYPELEMTDLNRIVKAVQQVFCQ
ncbi:DegT/DnrJ/EryC1/StrS family aminotransferase [Moorena producens JHB]|uniref:DegT/DnrJ/EryC1/StrS family aminotransferase n=1 Tax=Moorena producens (strain JHB) TaxID=1454205 RepID=A0A1D9G838_MOOP1|nr:DegT/DnrJ/EryC1/StrS family aminotransferase [Moorena producens]AOY83809.1 DegT/DnrJ/EryC1/StrS family aminotransferase [Moorena producens JHB]